MAYMTSITTSPYQTWKFSIFILLWVRQPGQDYKNLSWVWGVDRKFRPEGYCQTVISRDWFFLSTPKIRDRFFFLHTFHFWQWEFDNAVISIADVRHNVMTIPLRLVTSLYSVTNLTMAYRDVLHNQCIPNMSKFSIFIFPTGRIRVCGIRFASTGVTCGNPYPVCKKEFLPQG